jgi:hypothetical protein
MRPLELFTPPQPGHTRPYRVVPTRCFAWCLATQVREQNRLLSFLREGRVNDSPQNSHDAVMSEGCAAVARPTQAREQ